MQFDIDQTFLFSSATNKRNEIAIVLQMSSVCSAAGEEEDNYRTFRLKTLGLYNFIRRFGCAYKGAGGGGMYIRGGLTSSMKKKLQNGLMTQISNSISISWEQNKAQFRTQTREVQEVKLWGNLLLKENTKGRRLTNKSCWLLS